MPEEATIHFREPDRLVFAGSWRLGRALPDCGTALDQVAGTVAALRLEDGGIEEWDSALLIAVGQLRRTAAQRGLEVDCGGLPAGAVRLLALCSRNRGGEGAAATWERKRFFHHFGLFGLNAWGAFLRVANFTGEVFLALLSCCRCRCRMRFGDLCRELVNCGPAAVPIVAIISFLMGLILAFIGAIPLRWFQAENYVASLVGIGMLRLMAPVMVGIVMAGRTGAAYAAELGTMTVNEEVDAMRTLGIPPVDFLVMPRVLSLTLMTPLLCVFADFVSIMGGALVAVLWLKITPLAYFNTLLTTTRPNDLLVGIFTAVVLGLLDAVCGCYHGIRCGRSAAAVGQAATAAVVSSIVCTVVATSLITVICVVLSI